MKQQIVKNANKYLLLLFFVVGISVNSVFAEKFHHRELTPGQSPAVSNGI
jgi:hypothetical protein